jgi:hypothetical protein
MSNTFWVLEHPMKDGSFYGGDGMIVWDITKAQRYGKWVYANIALDNFRRIGLKTLEVYVPVEYAVEYKRVIRG